MSAGLLETRLVPKVWGREHLPASFPAPAGERIGEIWFEPDGAMQTILAKYLFTCEQLSVQVHPGRGQAGPNSPGKEECWLVLAAEPGARIALGFAETLTREEMRAAALDGSIEQRLAWFAARPGDFFCIPPGTVHAIGAGLTLVEIQQNCDITYRFYDYGRPRALHLDAALAVARGEPHPAELRSHVEDNATALLVDGPAFRVALLADGARGEVENWFAGPVQVLPLDQPAMLGSLRVAPGQSAWTEDLATLALPPRGRVLVCAPLL